MRNPKFRVVAALARVRASYGCARILANAATGLLMVNPIVPFGVSKRVRSGQGRLVADTTLESVDVLGDVVVGGGAGPVREAVGLHFLVGLLMAPALIFHPVNRHHDPGPVQAGPAVKQNRICLWIVHQSQEAINGRW